MISSAADSLWLLFVSAGLYCCRPGRSAGGVVLGALLLALGFFTKQTAATSCWPPRRRSP
jgi:uncharacterized membrane protein YphA (DoxX/SURF4 family)